MALASITALWAKLRPQSPSVSGTVAIRVPGAPGTGGGVGAVSSVNGQTGTVVLDAAGVEADPAGTAATSMAAHVANGDPHTQYLLEADATTTYAVINHTHAASAITSGTLSDLRLSSNVPLLNAANTFTNTVTISATSAAGLVINGKSGYYPLTINRDSTLGGGVGVQAGPDGSLSAITFQTTGGIRVTAFGAYVGVSAYNRFEFPSTGIDTYVATAANSFRVHGEASQTADLFQLLLPSSTGTRRAVQGLLPGWIVATDATRRGQFTEEVYDTAARAIRRAYSDGNRGYIAQIVHTTAPADADLNPSEFAIYTDGSGLFAKLKNAGGTVYAIPLAGDGEGGGAAFSGPINYPASAPGGWWVNPRDFGGDPSLTDNYPALLSAVNAAQGGPVVVPAGDYKFATTTTLTLPPGVTIKGSYGGPSSSPGYRDGGTQPTTGGTRFLIKQSSVTPFVAWHNGGFDGIIFYHPDQSQTASTPTAYPATVKMRGSNPFVRNCQFLNSYIGIDINNIDSTNSGITQRPTVENVTGQPLYRGITMGLANDDASTTGWRGILDCARFRNVHFNPWWSYPQGGSPMEFLTNLYAWQLANGYAFEIGDCDEFFASGCFAYGYNRGVSLSAPSRGAYGSFTGGGFDLCVSGVYCTGSQQQGIRLQGLGIALGSGGGAAVNVSGGNVLVSNSNFWHSNPAIACSGGRVSAVGCDFQEAGTQVAQSSTGKVNVVGGFANGGLGTSGTVSSTGVVTY